MLEAVNSVVSNVAQIPPQARGDSKVVVQKGAESFKGIEVDPYLSRAMSYNSDLKRPVLQIRDTSTGDSIRQFPTESQIKAYTRTQTVSAPQAPAIESSKPESSDAKVDARASTSQPENTSVKIDTGTFNAVTAGASPGSGIDTTA